MGLSIHYSGKFNKNAVLSDLITEVKEIAEVFKWKYNIFEDSFPEGKTDEQMHNSEVYGISFTPPKCETVSICFLSNYRMSDFVQLKFYGETEDETEKKYLYMLGTKTQFAGADIHKAIIHIFKYLNEKGYFEEFEMMDEGEYWETGDEKLLDHHFKVYSALIDNVSLAIQSTRINQGESYENYFERIVKLINDRNKKNN